MRSARECWRSGPQTCTGIGASPKHDQPLPSLSALSAAAARFGGTRKRIEWWISLLPGVELARDDVGVGLDVRIDERAVVVVERAAAAA